MEEVDGGVTFDFEGGLENQPTASVPVLHQSSASVVSGDPATSALNFPGRRIYSQTVCSYWLRGLCMKGEACGFLHQYDKSRMPICRYLRLYGECFKQDCLYKHTIEDIKDCCKMYKLGFCPNGLNVGINMLNFPDLLLRCKKYSKSFSLMGFSRIRIQITLCNLKNLNLCKASNSFNQIILLPHNPSNSSARKLRFSIRFF